MPVGFSLNDTVYTYIKNIQGDILRILDTTGNNVVEYSYDPWGVPTVTGDTELAAINPCSYRGYDYDEETGFYYLQSRYYDPTVGRFISADTIDILFKNEDNSLQNNLYAYCFNNPINMIDFTGESPANIIGGIVGAVGGAMLGILLADALGWTDAKRNALIIAATIGGAVLGAFLGPYVAKYGKKIANVLNSTLNKASKAAFKAEKKVNNFKVSAKHLSNAGGRYTKFNTTSQSQIRSWIKQALESSKARFYYNTDDSYYIIVDMGKSIGTKGERCIKVVFDNAGKIWTAYPTK